MSGNISHEFVDYVPARLKPNTIYVCIPHATVVHSCACGCGLEVVTPLSPSDWQLMFDGETVSLSPSIGNWSFPCRSHYWIRHSLVEWAPVWSQAQIDRLRSQPPPMPDAPGVASHTYASKLRRVYSWVRRVLNRR